MQLPFEVALDNGMKYEAREEGNVRNTNQEVFFMIAHSSSQGASLLTGVQKATFAITSNLFFSGFHAIFIINHI